MQSPSAIALFCEDIREELSGQSTIVGTLPDNLVVQQPPKADGKAPGASGFMGKLAVHVRLNFDVSDSPKEVSVKLLNTNGAVIAQGGWDKSVIDKAFTDSKANNMPVVGLVFKLVVGPVPVAGSGKMIAIATIDGSECIAGALNITVSAPVATASPPPA